MGAKKLGKNARLYRNTGTEESPTWTVDNNIVDLTWNDETDEADMANRESDIDQAEPTRRKLSIDFQKLVDASDAALAAYRAAYRAGTAVDILVLDGPIETVGSEGVRMAAKFFKFTNGQPLRDKQTIDITIKPGTDFAPTDYTVEE